jgi:hypothetical protein
LRGRAIDTMAVVRIGELLVNAGLLTWQQVDQALRAQVMWGGRLGTNIVELHMLDLDALSRVIARQHQLPAAFGTHFESADPDVQRRLSPDLASQYTCVPLRRIDPDRVAIASIAPLDGRARALIADQLGISYKGLVPAIAAELRIHYHLERVYDIPRDTRFLRSRKRSKVPSFEIQLDADDSGPIVERAPSVPETDAVPEEILPDFTPRIELPTDAVGRQRRHYIDTTRVGRIALKRMAESGLKIPPTLDDAALAIRRSTDRTAIAERVIATIERFSPGSTAALLVVRGDAATSWRGDIAVPLDEPGAVPIALRDALVVRSPAVHPTDVRLLEALGSPTGELVIAPIKIGAHVLALLAIAVEPHAEIECVEPVTSAAAVAFARLLRNANR